MEAANSFAKDKGGDRYRNRLSRERCYTDGEIESACAFVRYILCDICCEICVVENQLLNNLALFKLVFSTFFSAKRTIG